jgi:putative tricarboxylic transport membrane protein
MNVDLIMREWGRLPGVALETLSDPMLLLMVALGSFIGLMVGMLPGLSAVMAMSLLLGFTFAVPADEAIGLLIGIYVGAISAGGVTAILLNIPGTPAAAATTLDGFPLARQGRAKEALSAAFGGSFTGDMLGQLCTLIFLPVIAVLAMQLGDWEFFLVAMLGVVMAGALAAANPLKGWIVALLGLTVAMVGMDALWGVPRFGYTTELTRGFNFVPALIGLFGISEVLSVLRSRTPYRLTTRAGFVGIDFRFLAGNIGNVLRSVGVGVGMGIVPGAGESASPWIAYEWAKRRSKHPELFGKGSLEGVVAAETANNATSGGALIPALVFGIPGSGPTAILIAALFMHNIRPGPLLMLEWPGFVVLIVILFWLAAIFTRLFAMALSPFFVHILTSPRELVLPIAVTLGVLGSWAAGFTLFDVHTMLAFGIIGYFLRARDFPLAPMVLGILVGGIVDTSLRRALLTYHADFTAMLLRPVGLVLLALLILIIVSQLRSYVQRVQRGDPAPPAREA